MIAASLADSQGFEPSNTAVWDVAYEKYLKVYRE